MKRFFLAALLCLCALSLAGCTGAPMERQTLALCFGIDIDKEDKLTLSVQTPMNGAGSGGNSATPEYTVFSATGDDFESAFALLAASTPCPLNFSQLRLCVLSYELAAKTELRPLLARLLGLSSMRPDAMVAVALGNAQEVLKSQKPDFGMRMSTHLNIYTNRLREEELSPNATLTLCVRALDSGWIDPLLALCAVNPAIMQEQQKSSGGASQSGGSGGGAEKEKASPVFAEGEPWTDILLPESIIAGTIPRTGDDPVEYLGSATVGNGRVSGALTAEETQLVLRTLRSARLKVALDGQSTQLQIWLSEEKSRRESLNGENVSRVMAKLQELHCDALGFGGVAAGAVYTDSQWEALDMQRRYASAQVYVAVEP